MRGHIARGSRHRRRCAGHDLGIVEVTSRAAALTALALLLSACAGNARMAGADGAPRSAATSAVTSRLSTDTTGDVRSLMINNALSVLGQPYRYGGAAPGGFDCSGLVFYAAAGAGMHLPRTASEQRRLGLAVARKNLRAGDLIFMHLSRKELHVGIALDGSRFIHAPSTGGRVRIDSISAAPYAASFIGARRILERGAAAGTLSSTRAVMPAEGSLK